MEPSLDDPVLVELRSKLSPETWERRIAEAKGHLATIEAVEAMIAAGGTSETKAILARGGGMNRSTYRRLRDQYRESGFAGLVEQRVPPRGPVKATPEVRAIVCALRELDPHVEVERIAEVVARRCGVTVSTTVIKEVLNEEGLNRPPGGGVHPSVLQARRAASPPPAEDLVVAGGQFLVVADFVSGYSAQMAEALHGGVAGLLAAAPPRCPSGWRRRARGTLGAGSRRSTTRPTSSPKGPSWARPSAR